MTTPDQIDLEELDRFLYQTHAGEVFRKRVLAMGERYAKACEDRRGSLEDIRAAQGALEVIRAVLELPETLRKELQARKKDRGN